jgi:hypothetical protein
MLCGLPKRHGIGRVNYHAPSGNRTTHGEGSNQETRTEGNSRPRNTGVSEVAVALRLGPTFFELCSFRLKVSSVTSVTIKNSFLGDDGIPPRRLRDGGARQRSRPRGGTVSRGSTNLVGLTAGL